MVPQRGRAAGAGCRPRETQMSVYSGVLELFAGDGAIVPLGDPCRFVGPVPFGVPTFWSSAVPVPGPAVVVLLPLGAADMLPLMPLLPGR